VKEDERWNIVIAALEKSVRLFERKNVADIIKTIVKLSLL
jgi:hypothetical protein